MPDKVGIITGASRGIGLSIAKKLAEKEISLILISRNEDKLKEIVKELKNSDKHLVYGVDVSDFKAVGDVLKDIIEKKGQVDFLINNAGITKDTLLLRMREEDWDSVISINLKGVFNFVKHTIPYMAKKRYGKIINISSIVGLMGNPGQSNYAASKSGIIGFTKSIAKEYGGKNITANVIAPGFVETDMTKRLPESVIEDYKKAIPLRRFATPEDIANVVEFLISSSSDYITGEVINVSGGLYI
jgi:3-oxoacyl-[acyl-carrier protein] reductase